MALYSLILALSIPSPAQTVASSSVPVEAVVHADTPEHRDELRRARLVLENAPPTDATNDSLWLHLAFIEHKMGDLDAAQASFEKVVALDPAETGAYYMLGLLYEKKGNKAKAAEAWQSCIVHSKDPGLLSVARKHL